MSALVDRVRWVVRARSGASAIAQTFLARIGMLGCNLLTGIVVARALQPAGRGEQAAIALWPVLIGGLFTLGVPNALIYTIKRERGHESELFSVALGAAIGLGLIGGLTGAAIVPHILHAYPPEAVRAAQFLMAFVPLILIQYTVQAIFDARGNFSRGNQLRYAPPLATLVLLVPLALLHRLTPMLSAVCYLLPAAVLALSAVWDLRALLVLAWKDWLRVSRELFTYGVKTYTNGLIYNFSVQIEQSLLVGLLTVEQLGIFTVSVNVARILQIVSTSIVTVLFPKASGLEPAEAVALTARAARIGAAFAIAAAAGLIVILPFAFPALYGHAYARATPIARLLTIEVVIGGMTYVLSQAFMSTGRPGTNAVIQAVGLSVSVPFLLFLVPRYGMLGAAMAFVFATTTRFILMLLSFPVLLRQPVPGFVITRHDIAFLRNRLFA